MKHCKSCKQEIDDEANKCPHCHEYQNVKGFSLMRLAMMFGGLMVLMAGFFVLVDYIGRPAEYCNYSSSIRLEEISEHTEEDFIVRNYKVYNDSRFKWNDIKVVVVGKDDKGVIVETKSQGNDDWTVQPKSWSYLTVPIFNNIKVKSWDVKIVDLTNRNSRSK